MNILKYTFVPGFIDLRTQYRDEHLKLVAEFERKHGLIAAGATGSPPESGLILFDSEQEIVQRFIDKDPYNQNGLVTKFEILSWMLVAGESKLKAKEIQ